MSVISLQHDHVPISRIIIAWQIELMDIGHHNMLAPRQAKDKSLMGLSGKTASFFNPGLISRSSS